MWSCPKPHLPLTRKGSEHLKKKTLKSEYKSWKDGYAEPKGNINATSQKKKTRCCQHHHKVSLPSLPSRFASTPRLFHSLFLSEENFAGVWFPWARTELAPPLNAKRANKPLRTLRETPWTEFRKVKIHSKFARHYHPLCPGEWFSAEQKSSLTFSYNPSSPRGALLCAWFARFSAN